MTIEEAIEHAEDAAKRHECTECGKEHAQLAEWLKELKERRKEKHGHWVRVGYDIYECSVCGQNVITSDICCYAFCHGCCAKMGEVKYGETDS